MPEQQRNGVWKWIASTSVALNLAAISWIASAGNERGELARQLRAERTIAIAELKDDIKDLRIAAANDRKEIRLSVHRLEVNIATLLAERGVRPNMAPPQGNILPNSDYERHDMSLSKMYDAWVQSGFWWATGGEGKLGPDMIPRGD